MINGLSEEMKNITPDKENKFIYEQKLENLKIFQQSENNVEIIHIIHKAIEETSDFFTEFDKLFDKHFKHEQSERNTLQLQLFEVLYLRALFLFTQFEYKEEMSTVPVIQLDTSDRSVGFNVGIVHLSSKGGKDGDIPLDTKILTQTDNEEFDDFVHLVFLYFHTEMHEIQRHIILRYLVGKIRIIFELTKNCPNFIRVRRNLAYNYLSYVQNKLRKDFSSSSSQRIQFFELCGKSGAGKSRAVQNLVHLVFALVKYIPKKDIIYTRANDYWWNGYCGQPIILYDDLTHIKKKLKFDLAFEIIAVASGTFRNPPMAFDKDMIFTSVVAFITSNIPIMTTTSDAQTNSALKRRIISGVWKPVTPVDENPSNYSYSYSGLLMNSLWNNRSVFSMFSEVLSLVRQSDVFFIEFFNKVDIIFDEQETDNLSTTFFPTSSVSKSLREVAENEEISSNDTIIVSEEEICSVSPIDQESIEQAKVMDIPKESSSYQTLEDYFPKFKIW
jgi:hypothetical protein